MSKEKELGRRGFLSVAAGLLAPKPKAGPLAAIPAAIPAPPSTVLPDNDYAPLIFDIDNFLSCDQRSYIQEDPKNTTGIADLISVLNFWLLHPDELISHHHNRLIDPNFISRSFYYDLESDEPLTDLRITDFDKELIDSLYSREKIEMFISKLYKQVLEGETTENAQQKDQAEITFGVYLPHNNDSRLIIHLNDDSQINGVHKKQKYLDFLIETMFFNRYGFPLNRYDVPTDLKTALEFMNEKLFKFNLYLVLYHFHDPDLIKSGFFKPLSKKELEEIRGAEEGFYQKVKEITLGDFTQLPIEVLTKDFWGDREEDRAARIAYGEKHRAEIAHKKEQEQIAKIEKAQEFIHAQLVNPEPILKKSGDGTFSISPENIFGGIPAEQARIAACVLQQAFSGAAMTGLNMGSNELSVMPITDQGGGERLAGVLADLDFLQKNAQPLSFTSSLPTPEKGL